TITAKKDTQPPKPGDWVSKGTVNLGDGWTAKVDVNASARSARAQISQDGAAKGSLEAYDGSKSTKLGGYTFTLTSDGTITAKKDTQPPKPGDWVSKGTVNLGDGWTAKVDVNASARSARAQISQNGHAKGKLEAYNGSKSTKLGGYTFTLTSDGTITAKKDAKPPVVGGWVTKGTTKFSDGWTAKVEVNASARSARAELAQHGKVKGHIKAYNGSNSTKLGGYTFTLTSDGTITAKKVPAPKPTPGRTYVKTVKLADGVSIAKVYKVGPSHYQADIYAHGKKLDTLDAHNKTAYGQNNGLHVALKPTGAVTSWLDGSGKHGTTHQNGHGTAPHTTPRTTDGGRTLPQGGVKAGAENVTAHTSGSDETPLIAAGAGAAALGAAGLGFSIYRRKHNN
ncbi:hypothetical protein G3I40_36165, partial [Streptomyces sp. SID14478]|nr:hypothetical protein [Streptomyces sp. SID14478]